jgi:hypothetical protein
METNPCTILIPRKRYLALKNLAGRRGWRGLVSQVVRAVPDRAGRRLICRSFVRHQRAGQNLIRICFRPDQDDWLELGQIALHMGVSRCLAFVLLARLLKRDGQILAKRPEGLILWTQRGIVHRKRVSLFSPEFRRHVTEEISDGHVPRQPR